MQKTIVAIAILFSAFGFNQSPKWEYVTSSNLEDFYFDSKGIKHIKPGIVKVWTKHELANNNDEGRRLYLKDREERGLRTYKYRNYSHTLDLTECDCRQGRVRIPESIIYDSTGGVIEDGLASPDWKSAAPDSIGEALLRAICDMAAGKKVKTPPKLPIPPEEFFGEKTKGRYTTDDIDFYATGIDQLEKKQYSRAIESFIAALDKDTPHKANAYFYLGLCYINLRDYPTAIASFRAVIGLNPNDDQAHYHMGRAFLLSGEKEGAIEEYEYLKRKNRYWASRLLSEIRKK